MSVKNYITSAQISFQLNFFSPEITILYQPIIGAHSLALYILLCQDYQFNSNTKKEVLRPIDELLAISQLSLSQFEKSKQHLEAVGLIRTFLRKNTNCFNFKLRAPLSAKSFFNNKNYCQLLKNNIPLSLYNRLLQDFNISENSETELNISSSFAEIFSESLPIASQNSQNQNSWSDTFDQVNHKLQAQKLDIMSYLPYKNDIIQKINFYNFDKSQLPQLMSKSYLTNKDRVHFNFYKFNNLLEKSYSQNCKSQKVNIDLGLTFKNNTTALNNKIQEMKTLNNLQYANMLFNGCEEQSQSNIEIASIIRSLSQHYHLNSGVINCLLEFTFMTNSCQLPTVKIYKLAKLLQNNQITNIESAILKLRATRYGPTLKSNQNSKNTNNLFVSN